MLSDKSLISDRDPLSLKLSTAFIGIGCATAFAYFSLAILLDHATSKQDHLVAIVSGVLCGPMAGILGLSGLSASYYHIKSVYCKRHKLAAL